MPRAPKPEAAFIQWSRHRADVWSGGQGQPPHIGLDEQQRLEALAASAQAQAAYKAMLAARSAAKAATVAKNNAVARLRKVMGAGVATIDAFALASGDPSVWVKAQVPEPKDASARTAPPRPTDLRATIASDGSVRLTFKVASGGGALYLVQRVTTPLSGRRDPYEFIGFAGEDKTFTDNAVPEGLKSVGYRVAVRLSTGLMSDWSVTCEVPFGSQKAVFVGKEAGSVVPVKGAAQKATG
ncbi:MAG: hypothetical protein KIT54_04635 [Phycisphaeraceae bacterium]|nr:hypothetical protein [Phycisphaeraceae bacterium]